MPVAATLRFTGKILAGLLALCALSLVAQDTPPPGGGRGPGRGMGAPKNLKIIKPEEVRAVMGSFVAGTGMKFGDCHVQGDFASDEKREKVVARKMLEMVHGINASTFDGNERVTCYTCHRVQAHPKSAAQ